MGLVLVAGLSIGAFSYRQARELALQAAEASFQQLGRETAATVEALFGPVETAIALLARGELPARRSLEERLATLPGIADVLQRNPRVAAIYAGYADGAFFLVRSLAGDSSGELAAPRGARYLVQSVEATSAGVFVWLDENLRQLRRDARPDYRFDPRERPWYRAAADSDAIARSDPYVFFTTREIGKTFSRRSADGKAVIGADITLAALSHLLAERSRTLDASAQMAAFNDGGTLIAHREPGRAVVAGEKSVRTAAVGELASPVMAEALRRAAADEVNRLLQWRDAGQDWRILLARLPDSGARAEFLAAAIPVKALLAPADAALGRALVVVAVILFAALPLAWLASRSVARPLERLAREAGAIRRFDLAEPAQPVSSRIIEVSDLARSMSATRGTIRRFREVSSAIGAEQDFQTLLERVLDETMALASADSGAVYLVAENGGSLALAAQRGPEAVRAAAPQLPLGHTAVITQDADATTVSVPLFDRRGGTLGAVSLVRSGSGHALAPGDDLIAFLAALAGGLGVAIENQKLLKAQKDLLDALIHLVAGAIDAKSPYTGGHCQRVPELTRMLAQAACAATEGPFASYSLSDEEWEAVHVASWLHDCGKVTTPEYVVDKATKLETIYDRLHEVRMRFEVLKRDADVEYWRGVAAGGDRDALGEVRDALQRALDADFAFVAECNEGGEFMAPERVQRLRAIGARTWTRTLDDRIGLSQEEKKRKAAAASAAPPTTERLLDDKPEHIVPRPAAERMPEDNRWGFRLRVPEHKWNRGELHNLSIGRGTLTDEERFIINDHIVQTIRMLSALPFPPHLRQVPEIAGGHHEKMDGTGYPKRLLRAEMSLPARMMAIADIFEALTASDRPYKKAKTLSESLRIMASMKEHQHVDPDLFDLFLRSGVYLRYAERYLSPAQRDTVDIAPYLSRAR